MPGLTIYKASAGSGKTHQLTTEYLKLALNPKNSFKNILAVTFTKKATAEMRDRILTELFNLSSANESAHAKTLKNEFHWSDEQLQQRARFTLNLILNNYSQFQVSTIDSFFQTILKSFTREIGVNAGFTVEIDLSQAVEISVQRFFETISTNHKIKNWLTAFATQKIESGKNWDIQTDILRFVESAFSEEFFSLPESYLAELSKMDHFETIQKSIHHYLNQFIGQMNLFGKQGMDLITKGGLSMDSFSFKKSGVGGYFFKLAHCNKYSFSIPNTYVIRASESNDGIEGWCAKNSTEKTRIQQVVQGGLQQVLSDFFDYYNKHHTDFFTALEIERNLPSYAIVVLVYNQLLTYCSEQNIFLLPLTTPLLSKMVQNTDAPFIYEKTGSFLKNFMIDEFQDTSSLQWRNFQPLMANSLSQGNASMVVGDVKQSIYRWRNGNWNLLHSQLKNEFSNFRPSEVTLPFNWRSSPEVVQFNNWCFNRLPNAIDDQLMANYSKFNETPPLKLTDIYSGSEQLVPEKSSREKGFVSLRFFDNSGDETTFEEKSIHLLIDELKELFTQGFEPRDIAIIVRRNIEGAAVAKALMDFKTKNPEWEHWFNFVSNDSVLLSASDTINYVVSAISYLVEPLNQLNSAELAFFYANRTQPASHCAQSLSQIDFNDEASVLANFPPAFVTNLAKLRQLPLSVLTEEILQLLVFQTPHKNYSKEWPFIHSFKDVVRQFAKTQGEDVAGFLEWWNTQAKDTAITLSEDQNAIRILTIHKSKGLEYKAVILPFFHWDIEQKSKLMWCQTKPMNFLPSLWFPLSYSSKLTHTHLIKEYVNENLMVWADNLNLVYVAFTRAKNVLMVHSVKPKNTDEIKNIGGLLFNLASNPNTDSDWNEQEQKFTTGVLLGKGQLIVPADNRQQPATYQRRNSQLKFRFRSNMTGFMEENPENSFLHKGNIYHALLAKIKRTHDFLPMVQQFFNQGIIDEPQVLELKSIWEEAMKNPMIRNWFNGNWRVLNETTVLLPNGQTKRPDRILLNNESCLVIDFKMSSHKITGHQEQVQEYVQVLKSMVNVPVLGYLWYLPDQTVVAV